MTNARRAWLALVGGATLSLGASPMEFWPSTFVALLLLSMSLDGATARRSALSGWIFGTAATLGAFYWIVGTVTRFTPLPWVVAVVLYLLLAGLAGVTLALAGVLAAWTRNTLGQPVALGLAVLVAERYAPSIFPWQIAAPLIYAPWIPQAADLVGVSGLGAILAGCSTVAGRMLLARVARKTKDPPKAPPRRDVRIAVGLAGFLVVYGGVRTADVAGAMATAPRVRVTLVQGSIPPTVRWQEGEWDNILLHLQALTVRAMVARPRPELVVWSEGAFPFPRPYRPSVEGDGESPIVFPHVAPAPMLFGALARDERTGQRYNSAILRDVDGSLSQPVAKRILVPFGEYVPIVGEIDWIRRRFPRVDGLTPGEVPAVLRTGSGLTLGVLNCFEDTFGRAGAEVARTDLLVNITNDAWFGRGAAPWQHLMLARWRAIETRREMVRSVNTGVTGHVDALGRLERATELWTPTILPVEPRRMTLRPIAPVVVLYGPPLALGIFVACGIAQRLRARRQA